MDPGFSEGGGGGGGGGGKVTAHDHGKGEGVCALPTRSVEAFVVNNK